MTVSSSARPVIPAATIYLRDRCAVAPGKREQFFRGKEALVRAAYPEWRLVAAGAAVPFTHDRNVVEPAPPMLHFWRCRRWDTLYDSMYAFTDTGWYADLQDTLLYEHQDLLVGIHSYPTAPRPAWKDSKTPGHTYVYEEILLRKDVTAHAFLRDACWFADEVTARGWSLAWSAIQVTGAPSLFCLLWSVPSVEEAVATLDFMANDEERSARYAKMLAQAQTLTRKHLYPSYVEWIADHIEKTPPR